MKKITRRDFIKNTSRGAAVIGLAGSIPLAFASEVKSTIAVVSGDSPFEITKRAVKEMGGMNKFVSKGDVVVIKPNMGWDRRPDQAGNTNPIVMGALVKMAFESGAKSVKVLDNTCNDSRRCYINSGIEKEAKKYGATVLHVEEFRLREMEINGKVIKKWQVYKDFVECDCLINVPILKHHGLAGLTMGMKNWFGAIGGRRGKLHQDIETTVVDLAAFFKPKLTVLDAYRILLRNGPRGGSLKDVELKKTVIVGTDPVAVDAYGVKLFGSSSQEFECLKIAKSRGLGEYDLRKIKVKEIRV